MISAKEKKLLDLSVEEMKILRVLSTSATLNVSNIAKASDVPRTTVYFLLQKLQKRGLVDRVKIRGHFEWKSLETTVSPLTRIKKDTVTNIESLVTSYDGIDAIKFIYLKILEHAKSERLYFIQGNEQAKPSISKIDKKFLFNFHQAVKKYGVIVEGVAGEKILSIFKTLSADELASHGDRRVIIHLMPDSIMDTVLVDIIVIKDTVFVVDLSKEKIIEIEFKPFAQTVKAIINYLKIHVRKTDLNAYISGLLKK